MLAGWVFGVGRGGHADGAAFGVFELGVEFWVKGFQGGLRRGQEAPDGGTAITGAGAGPDRVAGLEGEVGLDGVDWGEVVVLDLAELEEAVED